MVCMSCVCLCVSVCEICYQFVCVCICTDYHFRSQFHLQYRVPRSQNFSASRIYILHPRFSRYALSVVSRTSPSLSPIDVLACVKENMKKIFTLYTHRTLFFHSFASLPSSSPSDLSFPSSATRIHRRRRNALQPRRSVDSNKNDSINLDIGKQFLYSPRHRHAKRGTVDSIPGVPRVPRSLITRAKRNRRVLARDSRGTKAIVFGKTLSSLERGATKLPCSCIEPFRRQRAHTLSFFFSREIDHARGCSP